MVNEIYLRPTNAVNDITPTSPNIENLLVIKTADDLVIDVEKPKKLISLGIATESNTYPVASYDRFGVIKIKTNTGLVITSGELGIDPDKFVEKNQGVENYNKFLYVKPDGTVGLTRAGDIPTKTSDLENDGDGTSPFLTENSYITRARIIVMFNEED